MIIGAVCISLKGQISPIWIAILFDQLEGVNNHLCSLMHGSQEIRENLVALQKLLALEDIKQETQTVEKAGKPAEVDAQWPK